MVKSSKIRHSKQRNEPVTIDLSAEDVKRDEKKPDDAKKPESGSGQAKASAGSSKVGGTVSGETKSGETAKSASHQTSAGSSGASAKSGEQPQKDAAAASSVGKSGASASSTSSASSATSSPYGRGGGASQSGQAAKNAENTPKSGQQTARRRGGFGALAAGLAGGILALAGAVALYVGGYLTPIEPPAPAQPDNGAIERLESELSAMREEIAALKTAPPPAADTSELQTALSETTSRVENMAVMLEELRSEVNRLSETVAAGGGDGAGISALQQRLAALEEEVAALPEGGSGNTEALASQLASLSEQVSALSTTMEQSAAETDSRIAAVEESLASLRARVEEQANDPGVALAIAASALRSAIDRGQPFTSELETFARLAPDAPEIAALREYAATGVPTAAAIVAETDEVANRIIDAARPDNTSAGLFERLWASAESLITVRPIGEVEGDDVPAIVARMEAAIKNGDYPAAISEYEALPDEAKAAGGDFIAKVRARQAADELVSKVLADALKA
jgi:hypothetical protein